MAGLNEREYFRGNYYSVVLFRLMIAFLFLWLSRILFYVFNTHHFHDLTSGEVFNIFFFGLRFDLSTLLTLNAPFILMMTLPLPWRRFKTFRVVADALFYAGNLTGMALNFADIVYFRFTLKRMTGDIFDFVTKNVEMDVLLPQFIKDFWFYFLMFFAMAAGFIMLAKKISFRKRKFINGFLAYYQLQFLAFVITLAVVVIGIRGGLQLKPIGMITAAKYTTPRNVPIILNTPFTILRTVDKQLLNKVDFFDEEELELVFTPVFNPDPAVSNSDSIPTFRKKNVIIIVMESLSSEHVGAFNRHLDDYPGFTPFLDSLMEHSLVYNGFANAKQSIEGIPAIVASLPGLTDRSFINSIYIGNTINSLASLLGKNGYQTSFFHGGTNGTMNFDRFANLSGFEQYHGRSEYDDDADFDGRWGIFDEPFFQYFAKNLDNTAEPFFSVFLSLSAHHPYTIPEKYAGKFRRGNLAIQESIMYADHALKRFFETAAEMSWYENTIFVITADHTSEAYLSQYQTRIGTYRIPIVFFSPTGKLHGNPDANAAQVDIMPSLLHHLHYDKPFVAFGENIFETNSQSFAVTYLNGIYQLIRQPYMLEFNGEKSLALYQVEDSVMMRRNLNGRKKEQAAEMERLLKAYIQQYYNRLIENRMTAE
jgi:phosphoglycerol transferase MdoB-like AlkP superfamily enzyme